MATKKKIAEEKNIKKNKIEEKTKIDMKKEDNNIDKNLVAKQKVDELFKDIPSIENIINSKVTSNIDIEKSEIVEEDKGNRWLEEQVDLLVNQVSDLENKLIEAKNNYEKLYSEYSKIKHNGGGTDDEFKQKLVALFTKMKNNYLGKNSERVSYKTMNLATPQKTGILDQLIAAFPFLREH